jgi:glycosyltransferase involved in cell wall biosynthesis
MIKTSAIISAYKSELYIQGCLEDLAAQTLYKKGELEIVICDSNSPENEGGIVKKFAKTHKNIVYFKTPMLESMYQSWNRCIKAASGKYVTNANTDDRHASNCIEIQTKFLDKNPEIDLVYSDCYVSTINNQTFNKNNHSRIYHYPDYYGPDALLMYQFGINPVWRKSFSQKIGNFPDKIKIAGDYWLNMQVACYGKAYHINKPLGLYLIRGDAQSFANDRIVKEALKLRAEYRKPKNIFKIYNNSVPEFKGDKNKIYKDLGNRVRKYYPAWLEGKIESNLDYTIYCYREALKYKKKDLMGRLILNYYKFLKSLQRYV